MVVTVIVNRPYKTLSVTTVRLGSTVMSQEIITSYLSVIAILCITVTREVEMLLISFNLQKETDLLAHVKILDCPSHKNCSAHFIIL